MSIWYVARDGTNTIAYACQQIQPGYATEVLDDTVDAGLIAYLAAANAVVDMSNISNQPKVILAIGIAIASLTGKTVPQVKAAFVAAWNSLP